ncbi:MAG: hypothetical protein M0Z50_00875 [Planctomycetia bacterium]|jgi:hypothetical protein|nr:hypothetical protein [Planctomycetia bacterium]
MNKGYEVQVSHDNKMIYEQHYRDWMDSEVSRGVILTIIQHETPDGLIYYPLPKMFLDYLDKRGFSYMNMGYRETP